MRLIDADEIKYREQLEWFGNGRYEPVQFVYESDIDIQPTVDAVPVIRCKDCKHWTVTCDDDYQSCECDALIRHKYFYCANGERKEENGK